MLFCQNFRKHLGNLCPYMEFLSVLLSVFFDTPELIWSMSDLITRDVMHRTVDFWVDHGISLHYADRNAIQILSLSSMCKTWPEFRAVFLFSLYSNVLTIFNFLCFPKLCWVVGVSERQSKQNHDYYSLDIVTICGCVLYTSG